MESIFNEEGMPVKHRFILKAIKLRKKITKLRMESMLFCLRKLTGGYLVFLWVQVSEVKDERSGSMFLLFLRRKGRRGVGGPRKR
ncbi:hypothetical protein IC582_023448 [Cucumis melo]